MSRNLWSALLFVVWLLPAACQSHGSTPDGWKTHSLGEGQVIVAAPADYKEKKEREETLVLTPPNEPGVTLRLTLHYLEGEGVPADIGVQFVRDQAKKKNLAVTEKGGKVLLTETKSGDEKGVKVEVRFWQIGFQNAVVVISATVVASKKGDEAVRECMEKTVPRVIDSLKKR